MTAKRRSDSRRIGLLPGMPRAIVRFLERHDVRLTGTKERYFGQHNDHDTPTVGADS